MWAMAWALDGGSGGRALVVVDVGLKEKLENTYKDAS
jgi:hypothetical protein